MGDNLCRQGVPGVATGFSRRQARDYEGAPGASWARLGKCSALHMASRASPAKAGSLAASNYARISVAARMRQAVETDRMVGAARIRLLQRLLKVMAVRVLFLRGGQGRSLLATEPN